MDPKKQSQSGRRHARGRCKAEANGRSRSSRSVNSANSAARHRQQPNLASRTGAAALKAHRSYQDAFADHQVQQSSECEDEMGKKRTWKPLDLSSVSDPPDRQDSERVVAISEPEASIQPSRSTHSRRPSADLAARILQHTLRRQQESEQHDNLSGVVPVATTPAFSPTVPREPTPLSFGSVHESHSGRQSADAFETTSQERSGQAPSQAASQAPSQPDSEVNSMAGSQRLASRNMALESSKLHPFDDIPPAASRPKPPSHYPAVKGTSGDAKYNQRRAKMTRQPSDSSHYLDNSNMTAWPRIPELPPEIRGYQPSTFPSNAYVQARPERSYADAFVFDDWATAPPPPTFPDVPLTGMPSIVNRHDDYWFYSDNRFDQSTALEIKQAWEAAKQGASSAEKSTASGKRPERSFGIIGDHRKASKSLSAHDDDASTDSVDVNESDKARKDKVTISELLGSQQLDEEEEEKRRDAEAVVDTLLIPVIATLKTYMNGERDYWTRTWVQPPDWCIDRSQAGMRSYFGEDWGTPPARVGRDPRYRAFQQENRSPPAYRHYGPPSMPAAGSSAHDARQSHRYWRGRDTPQRDRTPYGGHFPPRY